MRSARTQHVFAVVLMVLVAAGALSTFPHRHADKPRASLEIDPSRSAHEPRPGACLEHVHAPAGSECAICFLQRVASHGQFVDVAASDTIVADRGVATSTRVLFVTDSVCLTDPRGPPAA